MFDEAGTRSSQALIPRPGTFSNQEERARQTKWSRSWPQKRSPVAGMTKVGAPKTPAACAALVSATRACRLSSERARSTNALLDSERPTRVTEALARGKARAPAVAAEKVPSSVFSNSDRGADECVCQARWRAPSPDGCLRCLTASVPCAYTPGP